MRKIFLLAILLLTSLSVYATSEVKRESYRIEFLEGKSTIDFQSIDTPNGEGLVSHITTTNAKRILVGTYESEGGVTPEVKSVFLAGRAPKRLFLIVRWKADNSAIGTGGSLYQVYVYEEHIDCRNGGKSLQPNIELSHRFGVGFDGVREGEPVSYKYKDAASVRRQLKRWGYK